MLIKHFRDVQVRMRDPLRPNQWVLSRRLESDGTSALSHEGEGYSANKQGWFDVPEHVGRFFLSRPGWRTPAQVDEAVMAGELEANDSPASAPKPAAPPRKKAASE